MQGSNLTDANLRNTRFLGANLQHTNLTRSRYVTVTQLQQARNLHGATLPDGTQLLTIGTWRSDIEMWAETVATDENGYIIPAPLDDADTGE